MIAQSDTLSESLTNNHDLKLELDDTNENLVDANDFDKVFCRFRPQKTFSSSTRSR